MYIQFYMFKNEKDKKIISDFLIFIYFFLLNEIKVFETFIFVSKVLDFNSSLKYSYKDFKVLFNFMYI